MTKVSSELIIKTAEELSKELRSISVTQFFERNRHLLGYDNPTKALLTVIKEAVDNSADACEEAGIVPEIKVAIKQLSEDRYKVIVEDNGPGIVKDQIPKVFASLLYGSKFHRLRQSRGIQGMGISSAVLYSQLTTGKSAKITSKTSLKSSAQYYELHINIEKNEPDSITEKEIEWNKEHGTKVELELEGRYLKGKQSVDEYIKQTAIVNPHITIFYENPLNEKLKFPRATTELPKESKQIKPHPYGTELGILIRMIKSSKMRSLQRFLQNEFSRISSKVAKEICAKANLLPNSHTGRIARQQVDDLLRAIKETKIRAPPLDCLSPIGTDLLKKGVKKEINAEFVEATTRPPTVYRGNPFQIECCTGDSKIILEDGNIVSIKDYVDEKMLNKKVFSMNYNLKIIPSGVLMVHKFKNKHKIFKITTRTRRSLKLTENNKIPVINNGKVLWKNVGDVMAGEFVAVPRRLNVYGKVPHLLDLLNPDEVKVIDNKLMVSFMDKLKEKYGTYKQSAENLGIKYDTFKAYKRTKNAITRPTLSIIKKIVDNLGLDFNDIKNKIGCIRIVDTKFTNPAIINVPDINEDLLYILGLLNSDGYISRRGIVFVNNDKYLHDLYRKKINSLFGLTVKRYKKNESHLCNKTLYLVLKEIEKILPTLPNNLITSWIKGFVDGDGWVSLREGGKIKNIGIATAKRSKAEFVLTLLLRLGILSKIERQKIPKRFGKIGDRVVKTKKDKYNIVIETFENIKNFYSLISFRQVKRSNILSESIKREVEQRSARDVIPLGDLLRKFRKENNLHQYELGFSDTSIRQIEKNKQDITRINLQQLLQRYDYSGKILNQLTLFAFSDILWDKIVNIELMPHEEYVYDLTVETGNFVANNIVMHNCTIAYGGDIPKDNSIRLLRFANRVPLLYQQGACAITKAVSDIKWRSYGLQQSGKNLPIGPVIIVVHMASVWVPFTSEAKEAIAHYPEIIKEIKLAVQECSRKLNIFINRRRKAEHEEKKKSYIEKYIPHIGIGLKEILDLKQKDEEKVVKTLKDTLEKSRDKIK